MESDTSALRSGAACWSLAGDRQLLQTLQGLHQKMMSRCEETRGRLSTLVTSLDDANVSLQNVNNKFMALSNSQFVESRVHEDDADVASAAADAHAAHAHAQAGAPPPGPPDLSGLQRSLQALERLHEAVTILPDSDSDSSSDSDDDTSRVVLRPRQRYAHRPLPHIIGSQAWRRHWHAGLVAEDSESDECESERSRGREQYSDSEPDTPLGPAPGPGDEVSTPSSLGSERLRQAFAPALAPAQVAHQLAQRLRGAQVDHHNIIPEPDPEPEPQGPAAEPPGGRKMYRPEKPAPARIFSDEPPPLPPDSDSSSGPEDIFAELQRRPTEVYDKGPRVDLFGDTAGGGGDIFGDILDNPPPTQAAVRSDEPAQPAQESKYSDTAKKPIGGISLFGSNKNNESIGAAILKRHPPTHGSDDSDDSCQTAVKRDTPRAEDAKDADKGLKEKRGVSEEKRESKEKDLIHDLFAKPKEVKHTKNAVNVVKPQISKNVNDRKKADVFENIFSKTQNAQNNEVVKESKSIEKKSDLFSDNIFDDMDDIFTSNVIPEVTLKEPSKGQVINSLFNDDGDDLFADIGINKKETEENTKKGTNKIFDSDDELFAEKTTEKEQVQLPRVSGTETKIPESIKAEIPSRIKDTKSIFDDSDDSEDNSIFATVKTSAEKIKVPKPSNMQTNIEVQGSSTNLNEVSNIKNIFEDEDDEDLIFNNVGNAKSKEGPDIPDYKLKATKEKTIPLNSPNLFDDDDEDLFATSSKNNSMTSRVDKNLDGRNTSDEVIKQQAADLVVVKQTQELDNGTTNYSLQKHATEENKTNIEKPPNENEVFEEARIFNKGLLEDEDWSTEDTISENVDNLSSTMQGKESESSNSQVESATYNENNIKAEPNEKTTNQLVKSDLIGDKVNDSIFSDSDIKNVANNSNSEPDILADVFDSQPPVFEKPKEPKRSKNINALFDDDSDDEALFFKKNDNLVDDTEKPEDFSPVADDRLFGLFHDEPPAIDVVEKVAQSDIFEDKPTDFSKTPVSYVENDKSFDADNIFKQTNVASESNLQAKSVDESQKQQSETVDESDGKNQIDSVDTKKIGKLKPISLNINVNTLLPGASPKKVQKPMEQTDSMSASRSYEEIHTEKSLTRITKSVSFEAEPDSSILDNKLSKERAKIQVKRRPSTRRARREAVKVSGIDFGEDSTDNSSSIDDHNIHSQRKVTSDSKEEVIDKSEANSEVKDDKTTVKDDECHEVTESKYTKTEVLFDKVIESEKINAKDNRTQLSNSVGDNETDVQIPSPSRDVKSKVVYVLNDEDIFTDTKSNKETKSEKPVDIKKNKILNIINDDDDDIFKSMIKLPKTGNPEMAGAGINTLGKVYSEKDTAKISADKKCEDIFEEPHKSETKPEQQIIEQTKQTTEQIQAANTKSTNPKPALFDNLSDSESELFGNKKTKPPAKSKNFFDSDSDDDLFAGKGTGKSKRDKSKKNEEIAKEKREIEVKGSLFGDVDDDDLFGAKTRLGVESKKSPKPSARSTRDVPKKPSEPVYDDPLNLLQEEDA